MSIFSLTKQPPTQSKEEQSSIAKGRSSDEKLTKVRNEHSLAGKKSVESKSKASDEEGEE